MAEKLLCWSTTSAYVRNFPLSRFLESLKITFLCIFELGLQRQSSFFIPSTEKINFQPFQRVLCLKRNPTECESCSSAALHRSGLQADMSKLPFGAQLLPHFRAGEGAAVSSQPGLSQETTARVPPFWGSHQGRYETPKLQVFILPWNTSSPRKILKDSFTFKNYLREDLTLGRCWLTSWLWQAYFHFKFHTYHYTCNAVSLLLRWRGLGRRPAVAVTSLRSEAKSLGWRHRKPGLPQWLDFTLSSGLPLPGC